MKTFPEIIESLCKERHNMTFDECLSATYDKTIKVRFTTSMPIKQVLKDANALYTQQVAEDVRQRCADNAECFVTGDYEGIVSDDSILNTEIILP